MFSKCIKKQIKVLLHLSCKVKLNKTTKKLNNAIYNNKKKQNKARYITAKINKMPDCTTLG